MREFFKECIHTESLEGFGMLLGPHYLKLRQASVKQLFKSSM